MNAHNTFENPMAVKPEAFNGATLDNDELNILLPPMSIVVLTLE
jgi:alpha-N-arabinofuranosidase